MIFVFGLHDWKPLEANKNFRRRFTNISDEKCRYEAMIVILSYKIVLVFSICYRYCLGALVRYEVM